MKSVRWIVRALLPVLALVCVGCPEEKTDSASSCIADNPAEGAADFESDMWGIVCVTPYYADAGADEEEPTCEPPTVEEIEAECADDGYPCADKIAVSRNAALCIAREAGLSEGLEGLYANLGYGNEYHLPTWHVSNVLSDEGADGSSGKSLAISAVDGSVLDHSMWAAQP